MPITKEYWNALARSAEHIGEEFDWYALDREGFLGVFSTAGEGPVPVAFWSHRPAYITLADACAKLPANRQIEKVFIGTGTYSDWWELAYRGLFGFDYQDVHRKERIGAYDLIARPKAPIVASELLAGVDLSWLPKLDVSFLTRATVPDKEIKTRAQLDGTDNDVAAPRRV